MSEADRELLTAVYGIDILAVTDNLDAIEQLLWAYIRPRRGGTLGRLYGFSAGIPPAGRYDTGCAHKD